MLDPRVERTIDVSDFSTLRTATIYDPHVYESDGKPRASLDLDVYLEDTVEPERFHVVTDLVSDQYTLYLLSPSRDHRLDELVPMTLADISERYPDTGGEALVELLTRVRQHVDLFC